MITKVGGFPVLKISKEEVKKRNLMVAGFNSSGYEENGKLFQNINFVFLWMNILQIMLIKK